MKITLVSLIVIVIGVLFSGCTSYQKSSFPEFNSKVYPVYPNVHPLNEPYKVPPLSNGKYKSIFIMNVTAEIEKKNAYVSSKSEIIGDYNIKFKDNKYYQSYIGNLTNQSTKRHFKANIKNNSVYDVINNSVDVEVNVDSSSSYFTKTMKSQLIKDMKLSTQRLFSNIGKTLQSGDIINKGSFELSGGNKSIPTKEIIIGTSKYKGQEVIVSLIESENYGERSQGVIMDSKAKGFKLYSKDTFLPLKTKIYGFIDIYHSRIGNMEIEISINDSLFLDGFVYDGFDYFDYDKNGYGRDGYDKDGFDGDNYHKKTKSKYDEDGFDRYGYDKYGKNKNFYILHPSAKLENSNLKRAVFEKDGYDIYGFNEMGVHRDTGIIYDSSGKRMKDYYELKVKNQ